MGELFKGPVVRLEVLMSKENLQEEPFFARRQPALGFWKPFRMGLKEEDSFIQMNMDAQMNIPICVLAGPELYP